MNEEIKVDYTSTQVINDEEVSTISMWKQPEYVGHWKITPNFFVASTKKPSRVHIYFSKLLLGWEWSDDKV